MNIIIIINFQSVKLVDFEKYIIKTYKNLILCKSRINNNILIFQNIFEYLVKNNIYFNKIIYISQFNNINNTFFERIINTKNNLYMYDENNNNNLKLVIKKNYFYYLLNFCYSKNDIIKILIFYVIIYKSYNYKYF